MFRLRTTQRGSEKMRRIIVAQNAVIAGLITVIAIITGFFEIHGLKLVLFAVMSFLVLDYALLQVERALLKRWKDERFGKKSGAGNSVPGIPWHKVRFVISGKKDGNTRSDTAKVQAGTRNNSVVPSSRYSRSDGNWMR